YLRRSMKKETLCIPESGIMSSKPPSRESRFASTTPRADRSVKSTPWRPLLEPHFGGVRVSKWNARLEKPKSRLKTAWLDRMERKSLLEQSTKSAEDVRRMIVTPQ